MSFLMTSGPKVHAGFQVELWGTKYHNDATRTRMTEMYILILGTFRESKLWHVRTDTSQINWSNLSARTHCWWTLWLRVISFHYSHFLSSYSYEFVEQKGLAISKKIRAASYSYSGLKWHDSNRMAEMFILILATFRESKWWRVYIQTPAR